MIYLLEDDESILKLALYALESEPGKGTRVSLVFGESPV